MRGTIAFAALAALAAPALPLAAPAATTSVVGGVVIIDETGTAASEAPPANPAPAGGSMPPAASSSPLGAALVRYALHFVGVPYVWAGESPSGFDCSGFTQYVFRQLGVTIPRTADAQFAAGRPVSEPLPGDLVFFQTYDWGASHVGIYLGSGYFLNAIRPDVHVSSFASEYFRGRYLGARRLFPG